MGQIAKDREQAAKERFARGRYGASERFKGVDELRWFDGSLCRDFSKFIEYRIFLVSQAGSKKNPGYQFALFSHDLLL